MSWGIAVDKFDGIHLILEAKFENNLKVEGTFKSEEKRISTIILMTYDGDHSDYLINLLYADVRDGTTLMCMEKKLYLCFSESYPGYPQISKMKHFAIIFNKFYRLTIIVKFFILAVSGSDGYTLFYITLEQLSEKYLVLKVIIIFSS